MKEKKKGEDRIWVDEGGISDAMSTSDPSLCIILVSFSKVIMSN